MPAARRVSSGLRALMVLALCVAGLHVSPASAAATRAALGPLVSPVCLGVPAGALPGCGSGSIAPHRATVPPRDEVRVALPCARVKTVSDRCPQWRDAYDNPAGGTYGIDMAFDTLASHDGSLVYVTGQSWTAGKDHYDFVTFAYETATGATRWSARYDGPGDEHDIPQSMALSPDGTRLYATGWVHMDAVGEGADYATVAYDAATGQQLWAATYDGPGQGSDSSYGVAVSPDGGWVYVTGKSGDGINDDFATVAYRAATGQRVWVARYSGVPNGGEDIGISLVVSPDSRTLYVTGSADTTWVTIAYRTGDPAIDPAAGEPVWTRTHTTGYAYWIAMSPDGATIYVTGSEHRADRGVLLPNWDYATIAYATATGNQRWMATYASPDPGLDVPYDSALSPSGDRLYMTGTATGTVSQLDEDIATVAVDTRTGGVVWARRVAMPGALFEIGTSVGTGPGGEVYVAGMSSTGSGTYGAAMTFAYGLDGKTRWKALYAGTVVGKQYTADSLAVAPDGSQVFVSGWIATSVDTGDPLGLTPESNAYDTLTLAYVTN